jgi:hypothetical protein
MTTWTAQELQRVEGEDEMDVSSVRPDGSLRPYVTVWFVRSGDDLYVRSAFGPEAGWFARARASGVGRIRVGPFERDVAFEVPDDHALDARLHDAYHAKYDRYDAAIVDPVVSEESARCTLRLVPR